MEIVDSLELGFFVKVGFFSLDGKHTFFYEF